MKTQTIRNLTVALLAASSMFAQGSLKLNVHVPFGFHVGNAMLPAGEYAVYTDSGPGVVRLRSADARSSAIVLTNSVETMKGPSEGKLIFNRYGDEYFLSRIWPAGETRGRELRKTKRETEVAENARRGFETILAAK